MGRQSKRKTQFLGFRASDGLRAGIEAWLEKEGERTNKSVPLSEFLTAAAIEKLRRERIPIDLKEVLADGRAHNVRGRTDDKPHPYQLNEEPPVNSGKKGSSSTVPSAVKDAGAHVGDMVDQKGKT